MSEKQTGNELSAFHDGELNPAETESIHARLEHDAAARRELEELRRLSTLLSDLPRQALPSEFAGRVLQRCEQESLLSSNHADEIRIASSDARSKPNGGRSTTGIAVCILATSAMLFLTLRAFSPSVDTDHSVSNREIAASNNRDQMASVDGAELNSRIEKATAKGRGAVASTIGSNSADAPANEPSADQSKQFARKRGTAFQSFSKSKKSIPQPLAKRLRRSVASTVPGKGVAGNQKPAGFKFGGAGIPYGSQKLLDSFRIGDVIPYLEVAGNRTAVIEVTVVDVRKAVGRMEVLLRRKAVMPLLGKKSTKQLLTVKNGIDESRSELIAVYVESTQAQLEQVMRELGRETKSFHISLKPPVSFGDVRLKGSGENWARMFRRDRRRPPLTLADAVDYSRAKSGSRAQPTNGSRQSGAPQRDKQGKKNAEKPTRGKRNKTDSGKSRSRSGTELKKTPAENEGKPDRVAAVRSFQIRVKLVAPEGDSLNGQRLATRSGRANGKPVKSAALKAKSTGTAARYSSASTRPFRVMFVFRRKTVAGPRSKPKRP